MRRCQSTSSAAPTSTFFGSQPRRAHVPPYGSSSTTATCQPALRHRYAGADPAVPVPITMRSSGSGIGQRAVEPDYGFMSAGRHRALTILRPSSKASEMEMTVVSGWVCVHSAADLGVLDDAQARHRVVSVLAVAGRCTLRRRKEAPPLVIADRLDVHVGRVRDLTDAQCHSCALLEAEDKIDLIPRYMVKGAFRRLVGLTSVSAQVRRSACKAPALLPIRAHKSGSSILHALLHRDRATHDQAY